MVRLTFLAAAVALAGMGSVQAADLAQASPVKNDPRIVTTSTTTPQVVPTNAVQTAEVPARKPVRIWLWTGFGF